MARDKKILLMEDDDILRRALCRLLGRMGYVVNSAREGTEAVRLYRNAGKSGKPFNAVILDLCIHDGMGGKETVERIREFDPNVKAIVSSGFSCDPAVLDFQSYGFHGAITKPYSMKDLTATLQQVFEPNQVQDSL